MSVFAHSILRSSGKSLAQYHAGEHRDLGLLRLDIDRLDHDKLVVDKRQHNEISANDLRTMLIPKCEITGEPAIRVMRNS